MNLLEEAEALREIMAENRKKKKALYIVEKDLLSRDKKALRDKRHRSKKGHQTTDDELSFTDSESRSVLSDEIFDPPSSTTRKPVTSTPDNVPESVMLDQPPKSSDVLAILPSPEVPPAKSGVEEEEEVEEEGSLGFSFSQDTVKYSSESDSEEL
ncbi:uncharacterized protein LOC135489533 [Lineus longissimus]|uniref:uncharacterized protein LOC135489533 n=1 Tax=Lineus longissimus TaxID=88925 RepID=UPI002B4C6CAA